MSLPIDAKFVRLVGATPGNALVFGDNGEIADGNTPPGGSGPGTGDVVGPASATDNAVARFSTSTGKLIQNSVAVVDDIGNLITPGTVNGIRADQTNSTVSFSDGVGSFIESGLTGVLVTQGTASFPNRQGDAVNTVQGTDYDGTHVAGALWKTADSGYVAQSADYAGIVGGYDCLNNQIGGWISGSNHSVLLYDLDGHSYIAGGGYNLIEPGRCIIIGSTASAIIGNSDGSTIVGGTRCLVDGSTDAFLGGRDSEIEANASRSFALGNALTVQANHQNAGIFGQDATTPGADSFTRGGDQLNIENDVRVFRKTVRRITTDATVADPFYNMTAFEAGKVYAGYVKVKVIALHDDGVNGDAGNVFNHAAFEAETSFMWDEDSNHGNFDGVANVATPSFNLVPIGTDKIGVGGVTLNLSAGMLRIRVTGRATTTINWVAEIECVSTAAAS